MSYVPIVNPLACIEQGNKLFIYPAGWVDSILTSASPISYNVAAARTAMGLGSTEGLFVIFGGNGPFFANFNNTAAVPAGATADGSSSEYMPNQRYIDARCAAISLVSAASQIVTLSFYRP